MNKVDKSSGDSSSEIGALVNAFRYFNEAASSLNVAYRRLEDRIELLTRQLDEKDRELYSRLRELDRVTRYLSSLLECISSGVIAVDMDGNITIFNRSAAEMTNVVAESTIGKPYIEVMGEKNRDLGAVYTLLNGPELRGVEKRLPGSDCQVEVNTTWVVDSLGERIGVV
ncbi:MAG TPA: PAS domain-containing protein, partial [Bacteroidetes bacterium]|nr:PAS domain-containing protein [Bacteroidota bacterium]